MEKIFFNSLLGEVICKVKKDIHFTFKQYSEKEALRYLDVCI